MRALLFIVALIALALIALPVAAQATGDPPATGQMDAADLVARVLAGLAAPLIVQVIKIAKGYSGRLAYVVAIVAAYALAAFAMVITGGITSVDALIEYGSPSAILALSIYRLVLKPYVIGEDVDELARARG